MARGLVALAMLGALLGAPLRVSAAVNDLSAAQVSPSAGDVTTVFVMRVRYDGGFAAMGVTVTVAGNARPMLLEHGTVNSGTWVLATPLPAGTWSLTFAATASRGPSPTLAGPIVTVAGLPAPTASPTSQSTTPRASESIDQSVDDPASVDEPDVAPAASAEGAPSSGVPAAGSKAPPDDGSEPTAPGSLPGGAPAPAHTRADDGGPDEGATGSGAAATPTDRPGSDTTAGPASTSPMPGAPGEDAAPAAGDDDLATGTRTGSPVERDGLLGMVLVIGLIGVAAVALVGTLLLVAGRRRHEREEPAAVAAGAATDVTASDDLVARRTLRRARMRLADDPILSALGVDEQMQARRNRRARGVGTNDRPDRDA